MPTILRDLPFFTEPTVVAVPDGAVTIRPYQVIVWVSVAPYERRELTPNAARFPALLDTGYSHNFSIREAHLLRWGRVSRHELAVIHRARINRVPVPLLAGAVWVHPNRPGERDRFSRAPAVRLELSSGIAVYPPDTPGEPRLPLLGLRALAVNGLHLAIDGKRRRVALRTARRFGWF